MCIHSGTEQPQKLTAWISNNWRPRIRNTGQHTTIRVTVLDVIWRSKRAEVLEELKQILNVDNVDSRTPGFFQKRTTAAKQVLEKLTVKEREEVEAKVERLKTSGHELEIQQQ